MRFLIHSFALRSRATQKGQGADVYVPRERSGGDGFKQGTAVSAAPPCPRVGDAVSRYGVRRVHARLGEPVHRSLGAEVGPLVSLNALAVNEI